MVAFLLGWEGTLAGTFEKEIEALLRKYFATWSAADMKGYAQLFHPSATIYFLDRHNRPHRQYLKQFIAQQSNFLARAEAPTEEIPTKISISAIGRLARAEVDYEMTVGTRRTSGVDNFTLIRTPTGWRILNLIFYQH